MIVERVWVGNRLRNFNYVIACAETGWRRYSAWRTTRARSRTRF